MRQMIGETLLSGPAAALTARRKVIQVLTCLDGTPTFVAPLAGATSELVRQLVANTEPLQLQLWLEPSTQELWLSLSADAPIPPSRTAANHVASDWSRTRTTPSPWSTACPAGPMHCCCNRCSSSSQNRPGTSCLR